MCREQQTVSTGFTCGSTQEAECGKKARSIAASDPVYGNGADNLLEKILHRDNLNAAYKRVKKNGGSAGVDGMTVDELLPYLKSHGEELLSSIRGGWYKPQPVLRVEIPKPDGGVRMLGVPTVKDRMLQQAVAQVLQAILEPTFSDNSYGFRPRRSAHGAIKRAKEYYDAGYTHVVDIDLARYFDTVHHDKLMDMVEREVKDRAVLKLIRGFLTSGVMENGLVSPTSEGTPQGGNLSPLLSNIYLTGFDRLLESRGHKFVRYADDCNIYVKTRRAAVRVMASCTKYLEVKLKLKVNREKSSVGSPTERKFLGFTLCDKGGKTVINMHAKSEKRFKERTRQLTNRKQVKSIAVILASLKQYTVGWLGYYAIAEMGSKIQALNKWIRRRIRQLFWKRWKGFQTKHDNLVSLGVSDKMAWMWAYCRRGYWCVAGSPVLNMSITNRYLASTGYDDIEQRYKVMHSKH